MELGALYAIYKQHPQLVTDSRAIQAGCLFWALKGERFDANTFALQALEQGAAYAIVSNPELANTERCIYVPDTLKTLQALANFHRKHIQAPVLAVCGSNGKTTTKELLHAVFASHYKTKATPGNLNNHIGVPLTLLQTPIDIEFLILEIGANHLLETAELCTIAEPNFGLVTNNGKDHLEGFGSEEGVRKANAELYDWLAQTGGTAFVNVQHPDLVAHSANVATRIFYGDSARAQYRIEPFAHDKFAGVILHDPYLEIGSQLAGTFNWENIATAATIARFFKIPDAKIQQAIQNYVPQLNRSQWVRIADNDYLMDAYNANPSSMEIAITSFMQSADPHPKGLILGGMLELGAHSEVEHARICDLAIAANPQLLIFIGTEFKPVAAPESVHFFNTTAEAASWFQHQGFANWQFLVKGSRGYAVEKVVPLQNPAH